MAFQKLKFTQTTEEEMKRKALSFYKIISQRRSVRDFSKKKVPISIIKHAIKCASLAPSGANKQPWHFVIVKSSETKKKIRRSAEKEEKAFYNSRASQEWLKDLSQFQTDWNKPFLESAPYLIAVFKKNYDIKSERKYKNYYVNESVGIASGILLAALHFSGLVTLPHTPAPMGFLREILKRPKNEKAVLLIPAGYPVSGAKVPVLLKKPLNEICTII